MKLRTHFTLLNVLVVLSVTVLMGTALFVSQRSILMRKSEEERTQEVRTFAEVCRQAVLLDNDLLLASYLKVFARSPGVAYAGLVDADGRFRVHSDARFVLKPEGAWRDARPATAEERRFPVSFAEGASGAAVVGFDRGYARRVIGRSLRRLGGWILAASAAGILLGLFVGEVLASRMSRPIRAMVRAAEEIGRGEFQTELRVRADEELEGLARSLNQMASRLAALEELKEDFVSALSHDLRAPLSAISSCLDMMMSGMQGPVTPGQLEYMKMVKSKARQLEGFADDILDVARMKAGKMEYAMGKADVSAMVGRVIGLFQVAAEKRGTKLTAEVPEGLFLRGDEGKLERVLTNLVSNALKFSPNEGGAVRIRVAQNGGEVLFAVCDNGIGISPEDQERLFKKFGRVGEKKPGVPGAGIGLTIVKNVVEAHGGRIGVDSRPGEGSRFFFTAPLWKDA